MYTLEDVYKTFPSGCTEDYKILRAFEMGKQTSDKEIESLSKHILDLQKDKGNLTDRVRKLEAQIAELKEKLEITELALDNCLKESEVEK